VKVMHPNGSERTIPFGNFHLLPKDHPEKDNSLNFGELITSIDLPKNDFASHSAYLKVRDRNSYAFALVSVAAGFELQGNNIANAQIAMGGVAHKPWRALKAEAFLKGKPANTANFTKAAELEMRFAKPLSHNKFKIEMGKQTLINAFEIALRG
jgi:xanthine dehydrogenase YagS FAD-binding subunit